MQIREQVLHSADLLLSDQEANFLGPDVIMEGCRIVLQLNAKKLTLVDDVKFIDCDISAKRQLRDFRWHAAFLQDCRFHGTYIGNDFGRRTDGYSANGGIERCDFSNAVLDACRIFGCEPDSVVFPRWPCFTLINPCDRLEEMKGALWPGELGTWVRSFSFFPHTTVALTEYAPNLMKRYKVTEQELVQSLARFLNIQR